MLRLRMSARVLGVALALAVAAGGVTAAASSPAGASVSLPPGGAFGTPQPLAGVPGIGMSDPFQGLQLSCTSAGDCSAIGEYTARGAAKGTPAKQEAFVVTETRGHWGTPEPIAHLATLNTMGQLEGFRITCSAPGTCLAGGDYVSKITATSGFLHPFVAEESKGVWGRARTFDTSGLAGSNGAGGLDALSCFSAGNCIVGADYGGARGSLPFIVMEKNGVWGKPQTIPGTAALLGKQQAVVAAANAVSCADSADCTVAGDFPSHGRLDEFIATETGGVWSNAAPVPGLAALQPGVRNPYTYLVGLACSPSGSDCTAGGVFTSPRGQLLPYVLTKTGGTWGTARQLPGTGKLNVSHPGFHLSCPTQATCTIAFVASPVGKSPFGNVKVYVDAEVNGVWGTPRPLGGIPAGETAGATVTALACGAPGFCTIGGSIGSSTGVGAAFLAKERSGAWIGGPRLITLSGPTSNPVVSDLSCVAKGYCTAAAFEQFPAKTVAKPTAYLIGEGAASRTTLRLSRSSVAFGKESAEKLTITVSGPAAAKVTVTAGKTAVCTVVLTASGKPGSCTLAAKALKPGTYRLVAAYKGGAIYVASQSAAVKLTVLK